MDTETTLVEYKDVNHSIKVVQILKVLPESKKHSYKVYHNLYSNTSIETTDYTQALVLWVGLLAEVVERNNNNPEEYPFSKEQFISLVSSYVQPDSLKLNETLNNIYKSELSSY
jgi:hypothetical protein